MKPAHQNVLIAAVIVALTFVAFGHTLNQGFAPVDDDLLIVQNLASHGVTSGHLKTAFTTFDPELYIPLTFVSFQIDYNIAELKPFVYHFTNIALHALNACLVAWVLYLLTKRKSLSAFAGMLFAVHPLNVEAVAWLAGRKDLLFMSFLLGSWILYLRSKSHPIKYTSSVILFLFSLLSKVMAMTLPIVLVLGDWLHEGKIRMKSLIDKIPYAILSAIFVAVAVLGKERVLGNHSTIETTLMAMKSTVFYLEKFVAPVGLGMFYPYSGPISPFVPAFFVPILILLILAAATIWSLKYTRTVFFGFAFFLITLAPTFTNFHKGGEMYFASDRYPYLPSVGLFFLIVVGLHTLSERFPPRFSKTTLWGFAAIPLVLLTLLTMQQTRIWDSAQSIFEHTLKLYPESVAARTALASMDKQRGNYEHAISLLREGLQKGDNLQLRMALGTVYAKQGRVDDAQEQFEKAKSMDALNPEPLVAIGVLDEYRKHPELALEKYRKAVELDPSYVSARNKLATILAQQGKTDEAEAQWREALKWNPNAEGVLYNLSIVLDQQNKRDEARELLERAHALAPDDREIATALAAHQPK